MRRKYQRKKKPLVKHIKSSRVLEVDYAKLKIALKYVAKLHNMTIRKFAKEKAKVYNDIIFFLTQKEKERYSIRVSELNKIFKGFGLNPERFIYVPGVSVCDKFNPEYDLLPETTMHIKDINRFYAGKPKMLDILTRQISYKIKNFNVKIKSFEMYMTFIRSLVCYLRIKFKQIPITIESSLEPSLGNEVKVILHISSSTKIYIVNRLKTQLVMSCIDMIDEFNTGMDNGYILRDKKFKRFSITLLSQYLRIIEREILKNQTL